MEDLSRSKEPVEVINGSLSAVPFIASGFDPNLRMAYESSCSGDFAYRMMYFQFVRIVQVT